MTPTILVCIDHFLPGLGSGGPVFSLRNMVLALRGEYDIELVTRDCAFRTNARYTRREMLSVCNELGIRVHYLRSDGLLALRVAAFFWRRRRNVSVVYLNSLLSRNFSMMPLLVLSLVRSSARVVIAPRGELSPGALAIHSWRKRIFLLLVRRMRQYSRCVLHAAAPEESDDIMRAVPAARIIVAREIVPIERDRGFAGDAPAAPSVHGLRIAVIARIAEIKGHAYLIDFIRDVPGRIHVTLAGAIDDERYWAACQRALRELPARITWDYVGLIDPELRGRILSESHLFVLATQGESHGHAIGEALDAGCPVVISDRTPWHGVRAAGAGAELSLGDRDAWVRTVSDFARMGQEEHRQMRENARAFRATIFPPEVAIAEHRLLFAASLTQGVGDGP